MRETEGVGTMELVYVGRLLRMGGDSFLLPLWRSVGGGFTSKGESDVWADCSRVNLRAQGEHLTCWFARVAASLFVKHVCTVHLVEESATDFHAPL